MLWIAGSVLRSGRGFPPCSPLVIDGVIGRVRSLDDNATELSRADRFQHADPKLANRQHA